jgi:dolichyl-phosphate-mannose--protein O-mannosyl transferase
MKKHMPIIWLLLAGLVVRVFLILLNLSYEVDMNCFQSWARFLYENGLSEIYTSSIFCDYPPFYLYVLYLIGAVRAAFDFPTLSPAFNVLTALPPIACDLGLAFIFYRLAEKRAGVRFGAIVAAMYIFNPAIIYDSGVWGQLDSVYALLLVAALYLVSEKKLLPAYLIYAAAILTKPQSLIVSPVFLYSAYDYLRASDIKKTLPRFGLYILCAALALPVRALPFTKGFDFMPVIDQYIGTLDSYNYASVNAFNIYALTGGNWGAITPFYVFFAVAAVAGVVVLAFWVLHREANYRYAVFFSAALLNTGAFMFSIKMHERYLFPTLAFLLMAYVCLEHAPPRVSKKRAKNAPKPFAALLAGPHAKPLLFLYAAFSVTFLANCALVLYMLQNGNTLELVAKPAPVVSFTNVAIMVFMLYYVFKMNPAPRAKQAAPLDAPDDALPLTTELAALGINIAVYTAAAFVNLGNTSSPQTVWAPSDNSAVIFDFGEVKDISRFQFFSGVRHDVPFMLYASEDGRNWDFSLNIDKFSVLAWSERDMYTRARYAEIVPYGLELMLMEAAFRDMNGELLTFAPLDGPAAALADEQRLVPVKNDFMNSTYFDEIYHARTGYEYLHGLRVYENTHPPLGKDFIALSMMLFGATPFAWRLPGTLAGVFMVPLIWFFARMMAGKRFALLAALLFTFDFMHFAQTRIATIDSYVTLFVIGMYAFMYAYYKNYKTWGFGRILAVLAASGVFMGMAIASKWSGVYAAAGLAVLFFIAWRGHYKHNRRDAKRIINYCYVFFGAVPLAIYLISYIPYALIMDDGGGFIAAVMANQQGMFSYHANQADPHSFSSRWWQWPLMTRPLWFYAGTTAEGLRQGISSFGNPAVWWVGIAATAWAFYKLITTETPMKSDLIFLLTAYAFQILPWALVTRSTYIYHYFPSVPFVVLLITLLCKDNITKKKARFVIAYAALVVALFILFYPVLSAMPVPPGYIGLLRFLPGWVLA